MGIKRFSFFISIFFSLVSSLFAWELLPYREDDRNFLNLVFVALHYEDTDEFRKDVTSIVANVRKIAPFDEFKGLKVYLLEIDPGEEKGFFRQEGGFPYLRIRDDLITQVKEQLGGVYKLVVLDKKNRVSAAELSDIKKISVIILSKGKYNNEDTITRAFLHEFGHSLGLHEENPDSMHPIIPGRPNCATDRESAVKWWGDMIDSDKGVDYIEFIFEGNKFVKPTHDSIMNNPFISDSYGPVNERYLRREIERSNFHAS